MTTTTNTKDIATLRAAATSTAAQAHSLSEKRIELRKQVEILTTAIATAIATGQDASAPREARADAESQLRDLDAAEKLAATIAAQADEALARAEQPGAYQAHIDATQNVTAKANELLATIAEYHAKRSAHSSVQARCNFTEGRDHPESPVTVPALMSPAVKSIVALMGDWRGQTL